MKKVFYSIIALILVTCFAAVPVFATEGEQVDVVETVDEAVTENDTVVDETVDEVVDTETEGETVNIAEIIGSAESRLDAIVKIAGAMGVTLEDAEALLDKMVSLGDQHLGESDVWSNIKTSIEENPEEWTIVALVALILAALMIFIIRGLIKNTSAQAKTKANIMDIKENEQKISAEVKGATLKLAEIDRDHADIKLEMSEIRDMAVEMRAAVDEIQKAGISISEMAISMLAEVDMLKSNSESALNVNVEQALRTVELLNIALGRQLPTVSESTRRVWYEDSVAKIKSAAGKIEETSTEQ